MIQAGDRLPSVSVELVDAEGHRPADTLNARFAEALGLAKQFSDLGRRFARFAMIIKRGVVRRLFVQDVSGVTVSGAPAILLALQGEAVA